MKRPNRARYEFGPFRIDEDERLLRRGSDVIPLSPKAIDTLLVLVESRGTAVGKGELLTRVWPGTFVEEGSLAQNVSLLRKVLGDAPETPYIETIPKRGYRFVAPVTRTAPGAPGRVSLAVLPLANLSRDGVDDFFADGMTEELISQLMKIDALRVSSRTSVMVYKGVNRPLRQIAAELGVDWVVEGAVLQAEDRVRITVRVIDSTTDQALMSQTYERTAREVLSLQSDVASDIARQLRVRVTTPELARLASAGPIDPDAYEAYLRGRHFWNKRTVAALKAAVEYFSRAIEKAPGYAPAYAGLADAYALLGTIGYDAMPPREAMPLARKAAHTALQFDDTLAQAHASLGYVLLSYDWDWKGAEREFLRAIDLNASCVTAHHWYGHCLLAMGRLDEAATRMAHAQVLDPLSIPCNLGVGWAFYYRREYDRAIAQYKKTLEIAPELPMVLYELGLAYQSKGSYNEALATFERADRLTGGDPAAAMLLGHVYGRLHRNREAREQLAKLEAMARHQHVPALYRAFIFTGINEQDNAFNWLEQAFAERSNYLIYFAVEPSLDPLRSDARYEGLAKRLGLG